jgi:hypothetical protein
MNLEAFPSVSACETGSPSSASTQVTCRSGISLTWTDLTYSIVDKDRNNKPHRRIILNHLSGSTQSGELLAILGPVSEFLNLLFMLAPRRVSVIL